MKILMMFPYAPLPPPMDLGGTKRNLPFLMENLKRHEVSVLSFGTPEEERTFRRRFDGVCRHIRFVDRHRLRIINGLEKLWLIVTGCSPFRQMYRKEMQTALDELATPESFDLIHCCTQMLGYFRFPKGVPVIGDAHEVTYDLAFRTFQASRNMIVKLLSYSQFRLGKPEEIALCNRFDAMIATTERDYEVFRSVLPRQRIAVISNGVDPGFLDWQSVEPESHTMVFTGKMNFYPNVNGILFFLDEVFPRVLSEVPDARLFVVGAYPTREILARASDRVTVTGFVKDVRPYIARGSVFVIPLLIGGGIRGKALEAMAMKRPIVSTSIGCESIRLVHGESVLLADNPGDFADAVIRLFKDRDLRARLSSNAFHTVVKYYDWREKGKELDRVYHSLIGSNFERGLRQEELVTAGVA